MVGSINTYLFNKILLFECNKLLTTQPYSDSKHEKKPYSKGTCGVALVQKEVRQSYEGFLLKSTISL